MSCARASFTFLAAVLLAVTGCKAHVNDTVPSASAIAAAPAASVSAAPATPAKPWFSANFSGQYEAKLAPVEVTVGAVKEWAADDGKLASGPGKLALQIDDDGVVVGTSEGALGAGQVSGRVDADTLRVQLSPNDDTGLHGVLVASRDGEGFKGSIQASSGDSLRVRQATVELKKN